MTVNCCCRINDIGGVTPTQPLDDKQCQEVAHLLAEYDTTTLSDADLKPLNMLATRVIRALVNEGDSGLDQAEFKKIHAISEAPVATSVQQLEFFTQTKTKAEPLPMPKRAPSWLQIPPARRKGRARYLIKIWDLYVSNDVNEVVPTRPLSAGELGLVTVAVARLDLVELEDVRQRAVFVMCQFVIAQLLELEPHMRHSIPLGVEIDEEVIGAHMVSIKDVERLDAACTLQGWFRGMRMKLLVIKVMDQLRKEEQEDSAVMIQCVFRGKMDRDLAKKKKVAKTGDAKLDAILRLQKWWKSFGLRRAIWAVLKQLRAEEAEDAAVMIQCSFRGQQGRKRVDQLKSGGVTLSQMPSNEQANLLHYDEEQKAAMEMIQGGCIDQLGGDLSHRVKGTGVESDLNGLDPVAQEKLLERNAMDDAMMAAANEAAAGCLPDEGMSSSNVELSQDEAAGILQRYGRGYMGRNEVKKMKE